MTQEPGTAALVPRSDLETCASEPIHIPGSIQPRGVLLALKESTLIVQSVSANVDALLGTGVQQVLGHPLSSTLGIEASSQIENSLSAYGDLRARNPVEISIPVNGVPIDFDAILHRTAEDVLLLELEPARGPRPFSFPNTYLAVRGAVSDLNQSAGLEELYEITARIVRELTGFDRVMVYRYDQDFNGEVVAENKREDLEPFLGLHYPASDIPVQARTLYEKNWIRLISDVNYRPAQLIATSESVADGPLDLTHATLRSVSPVHIEYLQNMGVRASMSISLLRHGELWGLIACHHYSGAHTPPYGVRMAAEFLGSTLSLRLVDWVEGDNLRIALGAQSILAALSTTMFDESKSLVGSLLGPPGLLDLVPADGIAVAMEGMVVRSGLEVSAALEAAITTWAASGDDEVVVTDCLESVAPELGGSSEGVCGVIVLPFASGQYILWIRNEAVRAVDWGGDPHQSVKQLDDDDPSVRLSPRKSFERWKEVVRGKSRPWTPAQLDSARLLRIQVVEALYARSDRELHLAELLQRSLLPAALPALADWSITAHYQPTEVGKIGGDWYDAIQRTDGSVAIVVGDVAGHGMTAAGTMAQLRNALRAYLYLRDSPAKALEDLSRFASGLLPTVFATVFVACIDPITGEAEASSAGHLMPVLVTPGGGARQLTMGVSPPIGVRNAAFTPSHFHVDRGEGLILFSDGLVERRDMDVTLTLDRLVSLASTLRVGAVAKYVFDVCSLPHASDDSTIVAAWRSPASS